MSKDYHGQDGYTPQRGNDYWTEDDKEEIILEVKDEFNASLEDKVDKEYGKGLSTNDFTNILKEKLENLENYNDTEIRDLLNESLKGVNYTASNGILTFTKNDGSTISVDLPLELLIESGRYDEDNSQIVLVLANGSSINIPVSDLLDDFYGKGEIDNKLNERDEVIGGLKEENQSQSEKITALEKENKNQADRIKELEEEVESLEADYIPNTIEGETAVVSDGLPKSKIKADINGNSYQYSTEGYNIMNFNVEQDSRVTVNKDGTITINGNGGFNISFESITLKGGVVYMQRMRLVSGSITGVDVNTTFFSFEDKNLRNDYYTVYKPTEDVTKKRLWVNASAVFENAVVEIWGFEGTENKPFEPYTNGSSPNIEYPQEVEVITECSLVQRGKNILKVFNETRTDAGINIDITNGYKFKVKGTPTLMWTNLFESKELKIPKGTTITLSVNNIKHALYGYFKYSDGSYNQYIEVGQKSKTITLTKDLVGYYLYVSGLTIGTAIDYEFEVQLEKSDTATDIEPPVEPKIIPINLDGNFITKVGGIKDLLNIGLDGSVSIKNLIKHRILNGSENWDMANNNSANTNRFVIGEEVESLDSDGIYAISNKLISKTANDLWNYDIEGIAHSISQLIIRLNVNTGVTDVNTLKSWLSENNIECYNVGNAETINLPSIESITLFEGTNIFELVTNLGTTLAVTYKVSNKSRLEKLELALLSNGGNV